MKLFDSELKVMEVLWEHAAELSTAELSASELSAKEIVDVLSKRIGWNKNTTYTVIKKCIDKGAIERTEPGFICKALVSRDEVAQSETEHPDRGCLGAARPASRQAAQVCLSYPVECRSAAPAGALLSEQPAEHEGAGICDAAFL